MRWVLLSGVLWGAGCGSVLSSANTYRALGLHEIATVYYAANFRDHPKDDNARRLLVASFEAALTAVDADFQAFSQKGDFRHALGLATRKSELLSYAHSLGLLELSAISAAPELSKALPAAKKQSVHEVDAAVAANRSAEDFTVRLRLARALDPHNAELEARYQRMRAGLTRHILPRIECATDIYPECEQLVHTALALATRERRELTEFVAPNSEHEDTELLVEVSASPQDSGWQVLKQGSSEAKIARLDRLKEPVKNNKGEQVYDTVAADYAVYSRGVRVPVRVKAQLRDLRPQGTVLWENDFNLFKEDTRTYITWEGDERALGKLASIGTDHSSPLPALVLLRQAADEAARQIATAVVQTLEGATR